MIVFRSAGNVQCPRYFALENCQSFMRKLAHISILILSVGICAGEETPEFPLKSKYLENVADRVPDDAFEAQQIEFKVLELALLALKRSTVENLQKNTKDVAFNEFLKHAEQYRGDVVNAGGMTVGFQKIPLPENESGIRELWAGQLVNGSGILTVLSTTKIDNGTIVKSSGIFIKRLAYLNHMQGEKLTWTPLLIVQNPKIVDAAELKAEKLPADVLTKLPREKWADDLFTADRILAAIEEWEGKWTVKIDNRHYSLEPDVLSDFMDRLEEIVIKSLKAGLCKKDQTGAVSIPVKLSVSLKTPMLRVETAVMSMARVGIVNVQYAVDGEKPIPQRKASNDPNQQNVNQPKEKIQVHVSSLNGVPVYEISEKKCSLAELEKTLAELSNERAYQVRASYEPETLFGDVLKVFDACTKAQISECGLIPLRAKK